MNTICEDLGHVWDEIIHGENKRASIFECKDCGQRATVYLHQAKYMTQAPTRAYNRETQKWTEVVE